MSIAVLTAVDPYPTDAGKKVVLAGVLDYFADRFGSQNVHFLLVDGVPHDEFPVRMHPLPKPRTRSALGNVVTRTLTGRGSLQESLLRSRALAGAIDDALEHIRPDTVIYDTVRFAQYASDAVAAQQICYLDDLFSERYRAMLAAADRYPDVDIRPLGNFAEHVPSTLRPLADNRHGQRALLRAEQRLVRRSEDRVAQRFGRSLLVNGQEAALLADRAGVDTDRVQAIPPLIAPPTGTDRDFRGDPEFVFLGLLSLPHNDDGLRAFLTDVWPLLLARVPRARLRVLGRNPQPELVALVERHRDSVSLEGFVPDLGSVLDRAAALVNPLRFGSGVKLKVIEALGRGLPVVSTSVGADGIADGPAQGVLVADGGDGFADRMAALVEVSYNRSLSDSARAHFDREYSRDAVFDKYDKAFARS